MVLILFGEKKFKPVEYKITKSEVKITKGFWIFKRTKLITLYWIECDLCRLGPFNNSKEAIDIAFNSEMNLSTLKIENSKW